MANTPYTNFRLRAHTLADLDALAASLGGNRSAAARDAIHYWRAAVEQAGRENAEEFGEQDWGLLAHLNNPDALPREVEDELDGDGPTVIDWGRRLAMELVGQWEGRPVLPLYRTEKAAGEDLAKRVAAVGLVRGYALYLCLSHFWGPALATRGDGEWWHPETWLTPTAKEV